MGSKFNNWKKNEVIKSKRSHNNYFLIPLTKKNKRGWIMILEAFIAIMVLIGFFIATIQRQTPQPDIAANVYKVQQQILWEASDDNAIREDVIVNNQICSLENFVYLRTPSAFDYHVQTCDPPGLCPMNLSASEVKPTGDIYVNDRILSTTLREYNPTVIQLYFWYGTPHVPNCTIAEAAACEGFSDTPVDGACAHICNGGTIGYEYYIFEYGTNCMQDCGKVIYQHDATYQRIIVTASLPPLPPTSPSLAFASYVPGKYKADVTDLAQTYEITADGCAFRIKAKTE